MDIQSTPDYVIGAMRVMTMSRMTFFYVTSAPTPFANLDNVLDPLLGSLHAARLAVSLIDTGPNITRYYPAPSREAGLFVMEVGVPVSPATSPAGEARVKTLPPFPCAGILLWGNLSHIPRAYQAVMDAAAHAGLTGTGEWREWNYYLEDGAWTSQDNLMGLYMGITEQG